MVSPGQRSTTGVGGGRQRPGNAPSWRKLSAGYYEKGLEARLHDKTGTGQRHDRGWLPRRERRDIRP